MNDLWLKIKAWTKGTLISAVLLYALLFIYNNSGDKIVHFWWWFGRTHVTSVFLLTAGAFFAGVICTILVKTTFTTVRQFRDMRVHARADKVERDMADMRAKAAMLQPRPTPVNAEGVTVQVDRLGQTH